MAKSTIEQRTSPDGLQYLRCGPTDSKVGLVCIHGWGCQGADYALLFEALQERSVTFKGLAVDLPGHGDSPKTVSDATVAGCAKAALSAAQHEGLSDVMLIGHSMGGRIVMEAFTQAQASGIIKIRGIAFLDVSNYRLRPKLYEFDENDSRSKAMSDQEKASKKAALFQTMFSDHTPPEFELATLQHLKTLDKGFANAIRDDYIDYDHTRLDTALAAAGHAKTPFLNLQSTDIDGENQRFPLKTGEMSTWMKLIQEKVPQAEQFVVEKSAHFPHVDQPEKVADTLIEFMKRIDGT